MIIPIIEVNDLFKTYITSMEKVIAHCPDRFRAQKNCPRQMTSMGLVISMMRQMNKEAL